MNNATRHSGTLGWPLNRILFQGVGWGRLAGGLGGAVLGWWLLFGGLQGWRILEANVLRQGDLLSPEYFIVNKPVPVVNLLGPAGVAFSEAELEDLRARPFVKAVAPFRCNRFRAHADFGADYGLADFQTELFFEAVPDEFLEQKPDGWDWHPGDTNLPIVLSRDYLALYNFGFAQSQNLPQIGDEVIRGLRFQVWIAGRGKELRFRGRVAGFSQRINTILAPSAFLEWANAECGEGPDRPAKLIVKAESAGVPKLLEYFKARNYQYNTDRLRVARMASAVRVLAATVALFGGVVLGLALWVFALSIQLLIALNRDNLRKLVWLGYHPRTLVHRYLGVAAGLAAVVLGSSWFFLDWGAGWAVGALGHYGYEAHAVALGPTLWTMAGLMTALLAANYALLRNQIYRLT